jgi:hypothetical protein
MVDSEMVKIEFDPKIEKLISEDLAFLDKPGIKGAQEWVETLIRASHDPSAFQDVALCRRLGGAAWECINAGSMLGILILGAIGSATSMICVLLPYEPDPTLYQLTVCLEGLYEPVMAVFFFRADEPLPVEDPAW